MVWVMPFLCYEAAKTAAGERKEMEVCLEEI